MLVSGSYFNVCPSNYSILTRHNTYNSVTGLNFLVERGFPDSLVLAGVISSAAAIPALCQSQIFLHFITPEFSPWFKWKCAVFANIN